MIVNICVCRNIDIGVDKNRYILDLFTMKYHLLSGHIKTTKVEPLTVWFLLMSSQVCHGDIEQREESHW